MKTLIDHTPELRIGYKWRWRNTGIGNGYMTTEVVDIVQKRRLLRRPVTLFEVRTMVEPTGYPEKGTPYQYPPLCGRVTADKIAYTLSYGAFVELLAPKGEGV
jgi:hypothetical protein